MKYIFFIFVYIYNGAMGVCIMRQCKRLAGQALRSGQCIFE